MVVLAYLVVGLLVALGDYGYQLVVWKGLAPFPGWRRLLVLNLAFWPLYLVVVAFRLARSIDHELEDRKRSH